MKRTGIFLIALFAFVFCIFPDTNAQQRRGGHNQYRHGYAKGYHKNYGRNYKNVRAYNRGSRNNYYRPAYRSAPPAWAPAHGYRANRHVYFPDYYTFYDPRRNGYSYWSGNGWIFSPTLPSFMLGVDLGRARIQVMDNVPITANPYAYFNNYYQRYPPASSININIPHPPLPPMPGMRRR